MLFKSQVIKSPVSPQPHQPWKMEFFGQHPTKERPDEET